MKRNAIFCKIPLLRVWVTPKPFKHWKKKLEGEEKTKSKALTMSGPLLFSRYLFWKKM